MLAPQLSAKVREPRQAGSPTSLRFTIPGEPQGKGRARIGKVGGFSRLFTPAKTLAYEGLVAQMAQQAMAGAPLMEGPVSLSLELLHTIPRSAPKRQRADMLSGRMRPTKKPDADNVVKAIFDGINGVVWNDDVQVCGLNMTKRYACTPGVEVLVSPIDDALFAA